MPAAAHKGPLAAAAAAPHTGKGWGCARRRTGGARPEVCAAEEEEGGEEKGGEKGVGEEGTLKAVAAAAGVEVRPTRSLSGSPAAGGVPSRLPPPALPPCREAPQTGFPGSAELGEASCGPVPGLWGSSLPLPAKAFG